MRESSTGVSSEPSSGALTEIILDDSFIVASAIIDAMDDHFAILNSESGYATPSEPKHSKSLSYPFEDLYQVFFRASGVPNVVLHAVSSASYLPLSPSSIARIS